MGWKKMENELSLENGIDTDTNMVRNSLAGA